MKRRNFLKFISAIPAAPLAAKASEYLPKKKDKWQMEVNHDDGSTELVDLPKPPAIEDVELVEHEAHIVSWSIRHEVERADIFVSKMKDLPIGDKVRFKLPMNSIPGVEYTYFTGYVEDVTVESTYFEVKSYVVVKGVEEVTI